MPGVVDFTDCESIPGQEKNEQKFHRIRRKMQLLTSYFQVYQRHSVEFMTFCVLSDYFHSLFSQHFL